MAVSSILCRWLGLALLVPLLASLYVCQAQDITEIEFTTEEEKGADHFIGNTAERSGLLREFGNNFQLLVFRALTQGYPDVQYLRINPSNGVIHTAKNIDREAICTKSPDCSIMVRISVNRRSPGSESTELLRLLQVTIKILDINDEAPTFEKRVVNLQIPENLQDGHELFTSVASDKDSEGPNSLITYKLAPSTPDFMVTTQTSADGFEDLVITVKKVLDREEQSSYALEVIASDNGSPQQSSTVLVNVQVTDVNDNAPQFGRDNYTVNVLENSDKDLPVVVVSASDLDAGENARVGYSLSSQAPLKIREMFTVDGATGEVFSRQELDFEQEETYQFYVTATDHGSPPQSASALVTVQLMDVNDNRPNIEVTAATFGDEVTEHGSVGKFLAHIKVSDADRGVNGQVTCSIADQHFSLEPLDASSPGFYKIVLSQELDREEAAQIEVEIRCQDGDSQPLVAIATLPISVLDINDNAPQFVPDSLHGTVMEERPPSSHVMRVQAIDPDAGENARVTYSLGTSPSDALFTIDSDSGVISTRQIHLDREVEKVYNLTVVARDNAPVGRRMTSTATATVRVLDENDNPPRFTQQGFSTSITENLPERSPAGQVSATDDDIDQNARFQFSIIGGQKGADDGTFFTIDPQTGLLLSKQPFDREKKDTYKFSIKVSDPAVSNYFDIANVTVTIDDANDHAPRVLKPPETEREFTCAFNRSAGDVIAVFQAEDSDDPKLTEITYSVRIRTGSAPTSGQVDRKSGSSTSGLFSMDPLSGNLRVAREIRPEDIGVHRLEVVVRDTPGPAAQTTVVPVSVTVAEGSEEEMSRFKASSGMDNNVTIVSVIVVCTAILAIVIIVVICFIRRVDRNRKRRGLAASTHPAPSSPSHQAQLDAKLYQAAQWVNTVTPSDPHQNGVKARLEVPGSEKVSSGKKKKEVSFSLDDMVVESPDTSGSVNSVFASRGKQDGLSYKQTAEQSFIVMDGMTTPDFSQHLYDRRSSSTDHPDERQFMEVGGGGAGHPVTGPPGRAAEDRYSDASSGDTGTSDSGRGGSEDESHGHGSSSGDRGRLGSSGPE
ncbi:protocadherin-11 X-linked [Elysia marginata]|uniref:Protocadherin-11 X-linked n=1 Tax=Elysia marginata TaxID=1093978 RepID=A0AAV4JBV6_9GAST|nr:protocadherin-11 X-linked [Elysia marginata]